MKRTNVIKSYTVQVWDTLPLFFRTVNMHIRAGNMNKFTDYLLLNIGIIAFFISYFYAKN